MSRFLDKIRQANKARNEAMKRAADQAKEAMDAPDGRVRDEKPDEERRQAALFPGELEPELKRAPSQPEAEGRADGDAAKAADRELYPEGIDEGVEKPAAEESVPPPESHELYPEGIEEGVEKPAPEEPEIEREPLFPGDIVEGVERPAQETEEPEAAAEAEAVPELYPEGIDEGVEKPAPEDAPSTPVEAEPLYPEGIDEGVEPPAPEKAENEIEPEAELYPEGIDEGVEKPEPEPEPEPAEAPQAELYPEGIDEGVEKPEPEPEPEPVEAPQAELYPEGIDEGVATPEEEEPETPAVEEPESRLYPEGIDDGVEKPEAEPLFPEGIESLLEKEKEPSSEIELGDADVAASAKPSRRPSSDALDDEFPAPGASAPAEKSAADRELESLLEQKTPPVASAPPETPRSPGAVASAPVPEPERTPPPEKTTPAQEDELFPAELEETEPPPQPATPPPFDAEPDPVLFPGQDAEDLLAPPSTPRRGARRKGLPPRSGRPAAVNRSLPVSGPEIDSRYVRRLAEIAVRPDSRVLGYYYPKHMVCEEYRLLGKNLLHTFANIMAPSSRGRIITLSSSVRGEGKTLTGVNLSLVLAQDLPDRVLLIDADLRQPKAHAFLGTPPTTGLNDLLASADPESILEDCISRTESGLHVLLSTPMATNPSPQLESDKMTAILELLRERYALVVVDTPPVLLATDALTIGVKSDGMLFLIKARKTQREQIQEARQRIARLDVRLLGYILNDVKSSLPFFGKRKYYYGTSNYEE